jgi:hypothetical protein
MKFEGNREIIDGVIAFDGIVVAIADTFVTIKNRVAAVSYSEKEDVHY